MKYFLIFFLFFFSACSFKNYEQTKSKIIIIKSPKIKFADIAYIRNTNNSIELELFVAGNAVESISINHLICTSKGCTTKSRFNTEYLHRSYPDDILQNILLGHSIYESQNKIKTQDGFEQDIKNENVDIIYKVRNNQIFFKDKKNKIIFKIKDIQ